MKRMIIFLTIKRFISTSVVSAFVHGHMEGWSEGQHMTAMAGTGGCW